MTSKDKGGAPPRRGLGLADAVVGPAVSSPLGGASRDARGTATGGLADAVAPSDSAPRRRALSLADAEPAGLAAAGGKGGGKLSRSETVTVRLDPKLRYLTELAARMHRRTVSSYIEWAIEASLRQGLLDADPSGPSIRDEAEYLWDVDEADRFAKLALRYPHLLTHEEQVRWKLIRECPGLWGGKTVGPDGQWVWVPSEETMEFATLRLFWRDLCAKADGVAPAAPLPAWLTTKRAS